MKLAFSKMATWATFLVAVLLALGLPASAQNCPDTTSTDDCNDPSLAFLFGLAWIFFALLYPLSLFIFIKWLISNLIESVRLSLKD